MFPNDDVRQRRPWDMLETILLIALCGILLFFYVPANWTGIATDPGFTAWVAPISNRLHDGPRLYEAGTHMPLPPLSHVVLYLASFGKATWRTESLAHHLSTMVMTLLLYFYLKNKFPPHVSFLAAVTALATYTMSETVLFYNSLANLLVVVLAIVVTEFFRRTGRGGYAHRIQWPWLLALGFLCAGVTLSKQSIGMIAVMGCAAVAACAPAPGILGRARNLIAFGICGAVGFGVFCVLLSPWVNPKGLLLDVFITGSQCKGGTSEVLGKIGGCVTYLISLFGISFFAVVALAGLGINPAWNDPSAKSKPALSPQSARLVGWLLIFLYLAAAVALGKRKHFAVGFHLVQVVGLAICVFATAPIALPSLPSVTAWPAFRRGPWPALGCLSFVLMTGAIGYTLSGRILTRDFHWNGQTIPMFQLAMAALFWLILSGIKSLCADWPKLAGQFVVFALAIGIVALSWWNWRPQLVLLADCHDTWADCPWYQGARVTATAEDLHAAVTRIHQLAGINGTTLLLPEDPNLQECFSTARPSVSCAIIYADQYWPKYVDADIQFLSAHPPKVVIIGPEKSWRNYGADRNGHNATEDLIDRLTQEVLPKLYHLEFRQPIHYWKDGDSLAVYVRNAE